METPEENKKYIGLKKKAAEKQIAAEGLTSRIMGEDGKNYVGTCDYRPDRVNLILKKGKVVEAYNG